MEQEARAMYTTEQKQKAIETLIGFDHSYADTLAVLGYPSRTMLRTWWKEYEQLGEVTPSKYVRKPRYSLDQKRVAVDYFLKRGKSVARTIRVLGYPRTRQCLRQWIDELAPGERKCRVSGRQKAPASLQEKVQVVAELESRQGTARDVADRHGISQAMPYVWRSQLLGAQAGLDDGGAKVSPMSVSKTYDDLPEDPDKLREMNGDLKKELRKVQLELDVRNATLEIIKKDLGTDPNRLTNQEKADLVTSLRGKWKLKELLPVVNMAKSSYEYAVRAAALGESKDMAEVRDAVMVSFTASGGAYGYRKVMREVNANADVSAGEWTVRRIMREEGLLGRNPKKKRRYSSYAGEISVAPENTCLNEDGTHDFSAQGPHDLWLSDVTEFHIPAGKVYLSPIIDCLDGMPISWSISTSPDATLVNSSLEGACAQLKDTDHPRIHTDRGSHYRWPGWIAICQDYGLVRSMSRKECSPDNSRMEGFFGRLKVEFFYWKDWSAVTIQEFIDMLDAYLHWYRDIRLKSDLGYVSPMQYRKNLELAA